MEIRVLGAYGAEGPVQRPAAFLINDRVLLDAGSVPSALTLDQQSGIEHALISHAHLDHVAGLAYLTETLAFAERDRPLTVASIEPVVDTLRSAVFNDTVWPDFARIPRPEAPVLRYRELIEDVEQRVGDLWVTPVSVDHVVPTTGFILHDGSSGILYSGDTGPTAALWKAARGLRGLKAIILECAFPNRHRALAERAKHLTPDLIRNELDKMPPDVPVWVFHVKPQFEVEVAEELARLDGGRISLVEQDRTYAL